MNFDSSGGLRVASSEIYPQIQPGEKADDKIIVLQDTDGDGVSDSRTEFADGLLIPAGVVPDRTAAAMAAWQQSAAPEEMPKRVLERLWLADRLDQIKQHREVPPTSFVRFDVTAADNGPLGVIVPTEGIEAWVDSKPTPIWNLESLDVETGSHRVVLAIDRSQRTQPFTSRLAM